MRAWILAALLAAPAAWSQPQLPTDPCPEPAASTVLEGLDVRARLFNSGTLFYGPGHPDGDGYQVPIQPGDPDAGRSAVFTTSFWLVGRVGGELRTVAERYENFQFRPGATGADGTPPTPAECASADRIWTVGRDDVTSYLTDGTLTDDLRDWPVALGAPVFDGDGDPTNYNLAAGDQPAIRGDVTAFWAMTDLASARERSYPTAPDPGLPLGVDVSVEATAFRHAPFAATVDKPLAAATLYRYTVTNRSGLPIDSLYAAYYYVPELGGRLDDYIATDTTRAMVFVYDAIDGNSYPTSRQTPSALGYVVLESPPGADGAPLGLTAHRHIINAQGPVNDPQSPPELRHAVRGRWNDGTRIREGSEGYGPQPGPVTTFAYPGDPVAEAFWSKENVDGSGTNAGIGQTRGILATGPFVLAPGASAVWTVAILFARGADRLDAVTQLRGDADLAHALQAAGAFEPQRVTVGTEPPTPSPFTVRRAAPNPFTASTRIDLAGLAGQAVRVRVVDVLGREVERQTLVPAGDAASVTVGAGLAAGVYVVEIAGPGFTVPLTIAKTRR